MLPRTGWANSASRPCLPLAARAIAPRDTLRRDQKLPGRLMRKPPASKLLICSAVGARPNIRTLLRAPGTQQQPRERPSSASPCVFQATTDAKPVTPRIEPPAMPAVVGCATYRPAPMC